MNQPISGATLVKRFEFALEKFNGAYADAYADAEDRGDAKRALNAAREALLAALGARACNCAARLAGRVDGNVHFEGCPNFVPPAAACEPAMEAMRRALGDIISQTIVTERMGYTDPQDWQEKFQRVRQIARDALGAKGEQS